MFILMKISTMMELVTRNKLSTLFPPSMYENYGVSNLKPLRNKTKLMSNENHRIISNKTSLCQKKLPENSMKKDIFNNFDTAQFSPDSVNNMVVENNTQVW